MSTTEHRFLAIPETLNRINMCKTALYERIKAGELRPIKLGKKTVFVESEINEWMQKQIDIRDNKVMK